MSVDYVLFFLLLYLLYFVMTPILKTKLVPGDSNYCSSLSGASVCGTGHSALALPTNEPAPLTTAC